MILKLINRFCVTQYIIRQQYCTAMANFTKPAGEMANCASGVSLQKVLEILENFAPNTLSETWDNTGLLIEPYTPRAITKILLTNDLTQDVVFEAQTIGCELIISYHPPIFAPLLSVTQKSWKEKLVSMLLEGGIALYSPHTSWDSVRGGVNDWLASCLPFASSEPILPGATSDIGGGRLLKLQHVIKLSDAVRNLKKLTGLSHVRVATARGSDLDGEVTTVGLCAGSGGTVLKGVAADLYITGEMLHHDILDATQRGTHVILTNHSDSERGFLRKFQEILTGSLANTQGGATVHVSEMDRDPLTTV